MFERLKKPFLTVETGEAYQPVRIVYQVINHEVLLTNLAKINCLRINPVKQNSWNWFWQDECDSIRFDSLDSFKRNLNNPTRLGYFVLQEDKLYLNLTSFKRACLAISFFHQFFSIDIALLDHADFINKVFGIDEQLPHGFTELFKEDELTRILQLRQEEYDKMQSQCETAATAEEAWNILSAYTQEETKKPLPFIERYHFDMHDIDPDVVFLGFYVFLRGRELVAIKRWFGESQYTLHNAIEDSMEKVFGTTDLS